MDRYTDSSLAYRLKNCLQTILELESSLDKTTLGYVLAKEFTTLKNVVAHFDSIAVAEEDVFRIEQATIRFLNELQDSADEFEAVKNSTERVLH